ncbi:hypothetical protein H4R33_006954 [Dimargaris cristalligena]|nr:hypothetical protein H4R33_006954 [Dimargaris cristalligena]
MKPYVVPVTLLSLALTQSVVGRPQPMGACCSVDRGISLDEVEYQSGDHLNTNPDSSDTQAKPPSQNMGFHYTPNYQLALIPQEIRGRIYRTLDNDSLLRLSETNRLLHTNVKTDQESQEFLKPADAIAAAIWSDKWNLSVDEKGPPTGEANPSHRSNLSEEESKKVTKPLQGYEKYREDSNNALREFKADWEYLDFTGLNSAQKRVLFPALYSLIESSEESIIKLFEKILPLDSGSIPVDAPELQYYTNKWFGITSEHDVKLTFEWQTAVSAYAVLATFGRFPTLRKLEQLIMEHRPSMYRELQPFVTLLHWEFDHSSAGPEAPENYTFGYDCRYAGDMGFTKAEEECRTHMESKSAEFGLLDQWTAEGFIYFHRNSHGKPKLAIRVRRSAVNQLIKDSQFPELNNSWLPHSNLERQQELMHNQPMYEPVKPSLSTSESFSSSWDSDEFMWPDSRREPTLSNPIPDKGYTDHFDITKLML